MSKIDRFILSEKNLKGPSKSVDGYVQKVVAEDGEIYLYLYSYKSGGPNSGDSPSQSFHFDYTRAKAFKAILDEAFGTIE